MKNYLSNLISWLFIVITGVILFSVLFFNGGSFSVNQNYPIISIIIGIIATVLMIFIYHMAVHQNHAKMQLKWEIIIVAVAIALLAIVGIYIINTLSVEPSWDFGSLYNAAINKVAQGNFGEKYEYISNFPFQLFLVYIFVATIKITSWFCEPQYALMLLNLVCIIGTILVFYFTIRKLLGAKKAVFSLSLFVIFSPILLYAPIFYSDTISMLFVALCFYIGLLLLDEKLRMTPRVLLSLLIGLLMFVGFQIKATTIIVIIALAVFILLVKKRVDYRKAIISCLCATIVFIPATAAFSNHRQKIVDADIEIPKTHWVMMGLKNQGGFNIEDYTEITFPNLQKGNNLSSIHLEEIKNRLSNYGAIGYADFLLKKLSYTWGDGTYYISEKISRLPSHPKSTVYQVVAKDGRFFTMYNIFMNGMQIMLLLVIVAGSYLTRKDRSTIVIVKLAIIGLVIFLSIWETRSRYLINYLPLLFIFFMYSVDAINNHIVGKKTASN